MQSVAVLCGRGAGGTPAVPGLKPQSRPPLPAAAVLRTFSPVQAHGSTPLSSPPSFFPMPLSSATPAAPTAIPAAPAAMAPASSFLVGEGLGEEGRRRQVDHARRAVQRHVKPTPCSEQPKQGAPMPTGQEPAPTSPKGSVEQLLYVSGPLQPSL